MSNVLTVLGRFFEFIFINGHTEDKSILLLIINFIVYHPYLLVGVSFLIIGFTISTIKRIILQ